MDIAASGRDGSQLSSEDTLDGCEVSEKIPELVELSGSDYDIHLAEVVYGDTIAVREYRRVVAVYAIDFLENIRNTEIHHDYDDSDHLRIVVLPRVLGQ